MCVKNKTGQSALEFTLVLLVVIAAIVAMQIYMKRAVEGKLRSNTDSIGEQFEADNTAWTITTNNTGTTIQRYGSDETGSPVAGQTSVQYTAQAEYRYGTESVGGWTTTAAPSPVPSPETGG